MIDDIRHVYCQTLDKEIRSWYAQLPRMHGTKLAQYRAETHLSGVTSLKHKMVGNIGETEVIFSYCHQEAITLWRRHLHLPCHSLHQAWLYLPCRNLHQHHQALLQHRTLVVYLARPAKVFARRDAGLLGCLCASTIMLWGLFQDEHYKTAQSIKWKPHKGRINPGAHFEILVVDPVSLLSKCIICCFFQDRWQLKWHLSVITFYIRRYYNIKYPILEKLSSSELEHLVLDAKFYWCVLDITKLTVPIF